MPVGSDVGAGGGVVFGGGDGSGGGRRGLPAGPLAGERRFPGGCCGTAWPDSVALGSPFQL